MSTRRPPTVFALLVAIAFGLSAGPHPCHSRPSAPPLKAAAEHTSCHGDAAPKAPPRQGHDCCDPAKGGHALCDQACQVPAVLGIAPALSAVHACEELATAVQDRPLPLFVASIDHVPLS